MASAEIVSTITESGILGSVMKTLPPITVSTLTLSGVALSDLSICITIVYTSIMLYILVRDKIINRNSTKE